MVKNGKWIATVASIWIQCISGASYTFSIYSPLLKSSQGYDQSTLDKVSVFIDIGINTGILSGLLYTAIASKRSGCFGPWVVHTVGSILCFAGYFFLWLAVNGIIDKPPIAVVYVFMFMAAHAQTFFNTANVVTAVQNFPDYRGTIVGIMKGFLGLSGAILIQLYQTLCNGNPSTFLLILALFPTFVSLSFMFFVKASQTVTGEEKKHLNSILLVALIIAAYLMILSISGNVFTLPLWTHVVTTIVLLFLLSSPLKIAINAQEEESWIISQSTSVLRTPLIEQSDSEGTIKYYKEIPNDACQVMGSSANNTLQTGDEMNPIQAMCTLNFWFLFIAMICGMGSGLATINNMSQMGESLHYTSAEINTLISLWSIWNFLGRFGAGYVSDYMLHKLGWGRPLLMAITQATMTIGHIIIASGLPGNLYVGSIIVGVCYGSQVSLGPITTSDLFGVLHMGTIFNTVGASSPLGSYLFSVKLIGYFYDKEARASGTGNSCYGPHCFMLPFLIIAILSLLCSLVSLILFFRTRRFYRLGLLK